MVEPTLASGSSQTLEAIALQQPLLDTSLIIVHVNTRYESLDCCKPAIKRLLEARVAGSVYEHMTDRNSVVEELTGVSIPNRGKKPIREMGFSLDGIQYHLIDNEQKPGDYEIQFLNGRRIIITGGGLDYCHGRAAEAIIDALYQASNSNPVREIHLPADAIYESSIGYDSGEQYLVAELCYNTAALAPYEQMLERNQRSYFVTVNGKLTIARANFEEPTIHLALWSNSDDMIKYLRKHERVVLEKAA